MELKAYLEGILRWSWFLILLLGIGFGVGKSIGDGQQSKYTETTTVLLNGTILANSAIPGNVVRLNTPASYTAQIINPAVLKFIGKHYPRLSYLQLQQNIVVTNDHDKQLLFISVSDIHPSSAADIANYLAREFVRVQTQNLKRQIDYYDNWLHQNIQTLTNQINKLDAQIQQLTPPPTKQGPTILPPNSPTARQLSTDQYQLDTAQHDLYTDQEALKDIQSTRPLFAQAFLILHKATGTGLPIANVLSTTIYELIGLGIGLLAGIVLIIAIEFFSPVIRHGAELQRIVGIPVLAKVPSLFSFEQKRLLQLQSLARRGRMKALRMGCDIIGAEAMREKGSTLVLTSPTKKRRFAPILATLLASAGHKTLLIDADWQNPLSYQGALKPVAMFDVTTSRGVPLSFIRRTKQANLFLLPTTATLAQQEHMTSTDLIELLPELQRLFGVIIVDAPVLDQSDTHLLASKATQVLLLVKKRRDSLKVLKMASVQCQSLKLNAQGLLLS